MSNLPAPLLSEAILTTTFFIRPLHSSFITPFHRENSLISSRIEPEFHLPSCYNVQPPPPAQSKVTSFTDDTLFFIFYGMGGDVLQEVAAQEL